MLVRVCDRLDGDFANSPNSSVIARCRAHAWCMGISSLHDKNGLEYHSTNSKPHPGCNGFAITKRLRSTRNTPRNIILKDDPVAGTLAYTLHSATVLHTQGTGDPSDTPSCAVSHFVDSPTRPPVSAAILQTSICEAESCRLRTERRPLRRRKAWARNQRRLRALRAGWTGGTDSKTAGCDRA